MMEHFCKEIKKKICVDFENEEVQDIIKAVDILMNRFVDEFKNKFPEIKIKRLNLIGSMAEKTRIWGVQKHCQMEFDYLATMKVFPGCGPFVFERSCEAGLKVKYEVIDAQSDRREYGELIPSVQCTFMRNLHKCVTAKCDKNLCLLRNSYNPRNSESKRKGDDTNQVIPNGCTFCTVFMKTGNLKCTYLDTSPSAIHSMVFLWTSIERSLRIPSALSQLTSMSSESCIKTAGEWNQAREVEQLTIDVDFHLVLEIGQEAFEQIQDNGTRLGEINNSYCYLFPKSCSSNEHKHCWRISTYDAEAKLLNQTSEQHLLAFRVLKFLRLMFINASGAFPSLLSYEMKLIVLSHIKHCDTPCIGAHECLLNILQCISTCKETAFMLHPILNSNLYKILNMNNIEEYRAKIFKMFNLILAYQWKPYTINDLVSDLTSFIRLSKTKQLNFPGDEGLLRLYRLIAEERETKAPERVLRNIELYKLPLEVLAEIRYSVLTCDIAAMKDLKQSPYISFINYVINLIQYVNGYSMLQIRRQSGESIA